MREFQPAMWGWTPYHGRLEVRARIEPSAADWRPGRVDFLVDGRPVKTVGQAPDYPMQMMVAVFDFPEKASAATDGHVPLLAAARPRGAVVPDRPVHALRGVLRAVGRSTCAYRTGSVRIPALLRRTPNR